VKPKDLQNIFVLLDSHWKHTKISEAVQLARASGVIMLSLPGHDFYRLQPLGVGFLRPANSHYEAKKVRNGSEGFPGDKSVRKMRECCFSFKYCYLLQQQLFFIYRMNNPVACSVQLAANLSQHEA